VVGTKPGRNKILFVDDSDKNRQEITKLGGNILTAASLDEAITLLTCQVIRSCSFERAEIRCLLQRSSQRLDLSIVDRADFVLVDLSRGARHLVATPLATGRAVSLTMPRSDGIISTLR
jgi:hypothetical protein